MKIENKHTVEPLVHANILNSYRVRASPQEKEYQDPLPWFKLQRN